MTPWLKRAATVWESAQVELHGQYSLHRLQDVAKHMGETSAWAHAAVSLLTPVPCLLLVSLIDSFELEAPEKGIVASYRFWIRISVCALVVSLTELAQLQSLVPILALDTRKIVTITLFASSMALASIIGFACLIGFPLPFTFPMACPAWFTSIVIGFWYFCGGIVRSNPQASKDVKNFLATVLCQISLTVIYPMYAYVFASLTALHQAAFVLLLPCMKIAAKNILNYCLTDLHDLKPEFVILNVEIFNALYVSLCMQSSASPMSTFALVAADFVLAWLSINDMKELIREINVLLAKIPVPRGRRHPLNVIEAAVMVIESDAQVSRHSSLQAMCRQAMYLTQTQVEKKKLSTGFRSKMVARQLMRKVTVIPHAISPEAGTTRPQHKTQNKTRVTADDSQLPEAMQQVHDPQKSQPDTLETEIGLSEQERLELVQKVTKVLYITEYAALVEYTEVVTPVIYSIYLVIMFYLPNRAFYPQLADMTQSHLASNVSHVLLYAALELLSLVAMEKVLKWKLGISIMSQVTYVLRTQWRMVQAKFALWVMYVVQAYLVHFGVDFTFQFKWLAKPMLVSLLTRVVPASESAQAVFHGQYSLQRLQDVNKYMKETSAWVNVTTPDKGMRANYRFWLRLFVCVAVTSVTELAQLQAVVPILTLSARKILTIAFLSTSTVLANDMALAFQVGFPLLFTFSMGCPACAITNSTGFWYYCGNIIKRDPQARKDVRGFLAIVILRIALTAVYPTYAYVFASLTALRQTAFVLLLPCMKIVTKNLINYCLDGLDDLKPEFVVLNVEIFYAFYVSLCVRIQSSLKKSTDSEKLSITFGHRFKHDGPFIFVTSTRLGLKVVPARHISRF